MSGQTCQVWLRYGTGEVIHVDFKPQLHITFTPEPDIDPQLMEMFAVETFVTPCLFASRLSNKIIKSRPYILYTRKTGLLLPAVLHGEISNDAS